MGLIGRFQVGMTGYLDRKRFWIRFVMHLVASIALTALWVALAQIWLDERPLLVIVPIRLLLVIPQFSIYVRRLHDASQSGKWIMCLLALYALGAAALIHYGHRLETTGAELAPMRRHSPDESTADVQSVYDNNLSTAVIVGSGVLTGLPGPLQLFFAVIVGSLKRHASTA